MIFLRSFFTYVSNNKNKILWSVSISFILIIFINIGSVIQTIFTNLITGNSDNLYDLLSSNGIIENINFINFIYNGSIFLTTIEFLIFYIFIYFSIHFKKSRKIYLSLSISIFLSFSSIDFLHSIYFNQIFNLGENLISNLTGGFFISLLLITAFHYINKCVRQNNTQHIISKNILFIIIFILFFFILFIIFKIIFTSSTTTIKATIDPDFSLDYSSKEKKFGLFSDEEKNINNIKYEGVVDKLNFNYRYTGKNDFSFLFFDGCIDKKTEDLIKNSKNQLQYNNINTLDLNFNNGLTEFSTYSKDKLQKIKFKNKVNIVNLNLSKNKDNSYKISFFTKNDPGLKIYSNNDVEYYRFDLPLLGSKKIIDRFVKIKQLHKNLIFTTNSNKEIPNKLECLPINLNNRDKISINSPVVTIILKIKKNITYNNFNQPSQADISNLTGWFYQYNLNKSELSNYIPDGTLDYFSINGKFDSLFMDNQKIDLQKKNWLYLQKGIINARFEDEYLIINAKTPIAFLDNSRASKSIWEKNTALITAIVAAIIQISAFIYLIKVLIKIFKDNEELF